VHATQAAHLLLLQQQCPPLSHLHPNLSLQLSRTCSSSGSNARRLGSSVDVLALLQLQV
jgi:hypothetical protein